MSTNSKNRLSPAFLKNFTTMIERRTILVDKNTDISPEFERRISAINTKVNLIIQNLNIRITDRQIPYITLSIKYGDTIEHRTRVYVHDYATKEDSEANVKNQLEVNDEISHILDFLIAPGYKYIRVSPIACDAELVIDNSLVECAVVDILLDIAMFNSYSFLKKQTDADRKIFSQQKFDFYMQQSLGSFYERNNDKIQYYSFAFSSRYSIDNIDLDHYIGIWTNFISAYYSQSRHVNLTITDQLKYHVDIEELPKTLSKRFSKLECGAYLVLRTNKDRTEDLHNTLFALFGIKKYNKGKIKIVPISSYSTHFELFKNLDVSAFKIVK